MTDKLKISSPVEQETRGKLRDYVALCECEEEAAKRKANKARRALRLIDEYLDLDELLDVLNNL